MLLLMVEEYCADASGCRTANRERTRVSHRPMRAQWQSMLGESKNKDHKQFCRVRSEEI